jgi:hypothetical protein
MDQQALQQKLAKAEAHVVECARQVAGQREELRRAGGDIETALIMLAQCEQMLQFHMAHRDRLRQISSEDNKDN